METVQRHEDEITKRIGKKAVMKNESLILLILMQMTAMATLCLPRHKKTLLNTSRIN